MGNLEKELISAIDTEDLSTTEKLISVSYDIEKFKNFLYVISEKFTYMDGFGQRIIDLVIAFNAVLAKREEELNVTCMSATKKKLEDICNVCKINYGHRCSECDTISFVNNDFEDVLSKIYDYDNDSIYYATLEFIKEEIKKCPETMINLYNDKIETPFYKVANLINKFDLNDNRYKDFNIVINSPCYSPILKGVKEIRCNDTILINI